MIKKLISHRGNLDGPNAELENRQSYIQCAINFGFDVEIDIHMVDNSLFLGHDWPTYTVDLQWLLNRKNNLWIHTKNFNALNYLIKYDLKIFYHQKENHTIINNSNIIWSHDIVEANDNSVIPLITLEDINNFTMKNVYGICSDYISIVKDKL